MNDNLKEIGLRIAQARKKKSMSQADLAEKAQVSISHISDIENGKKQIGIEIFIRITEALNVSADWLLRASNNEVKQIQRNEFDELLSDCTAAERKSLLRIMQDVKEALFKYKDSMLILLNSTLILSQNMT